jgi:hypothetical protein
VSSLDTVKRSAVHTALGAAGSGHGPLSQLFHRYERAAAVAPRSPNKGNGANIGSAPAWRLHTGPAGRPMHPQKLSLTLRR